MALVVGLSLSVIAPGQESSQVPNTSPTPVSPSSWMTKGTYATYEGSTNILSMDVSFTARLEVVDSNATHIEVQTDFNMSTPFGNQENTTTTWVPKDNMTFQPAGLSLNSSYTTQVTLPGIGTRSCTVYQYSSQGLSASYYVDNALQWPVKMTMTSPTDIDNGQSYSMDVNLVSTNIPGL